MKENDECECQPDGCRRWCVWPDCLTDEEHVELLASLDDV